MKSHASFAQILSSYASNDAPTKTQHQSSEQFIDEMPNVNVHISNHAKLLSFISSDSQSPTFGVPRNASQTNSAMDAFTQLDGILSVWH